MIPVRCKDGKIHAVSFKNTQNVVCGIRVSVQQINPDFSKLKNIIWCYECSAQLENYENNNHLEVKIKS